MVAAMVSKLKQRRVRRLKADVAWWRDEAEDCRSRLLELAGEIDRLKSWLSAFRCRWWFRRR